VWWVEAFLRAWHDAVRESLQYAMRRIDYEPAKPPTVNQQMWLIWKRRSHAREELFGPRLFGHTFFGQYQKGVRLWQNIAELSPPIFRIGKYELEATRVKSKRQMKKHEGDALILDDNSVWGLDLFASRTASFWLLSDELEVDDSPFRSSITNARSNETVKSRMVRPPESTLET
jgi:hypothetical protein